MFVAIITEIWSQRNKVVFSNGKANYLEIFSLAQIKCWSWCKAYKPKSHFSYAEWCISPIDCPKL